MTKRSKRISRILINKIARRTKHFAVRRKKHFALNKILIPAHTSAGGWGIDSAGRTVDLGGPLHLCRERQDITLSYEKNLYSREGNPEPVSELRACIRIIFGNHRTRDPVLRKWDESLALCNWNGSFIPWDVIKSRVKY